MSGNIRVTMGGPKSEPEETDDTEVETPVVDETVEEDDEETEEDDVDQPTLAAPKVPELEDLDPDAEVWPGGPKAKLVQKWKKLHREIYVSVFLEDYVLWRPIKRSEYKEHVLNLEAMSESQGLSPSEANFLNEEIITAMCVLYPKWDMDDLDDGLAGIPSLISQEILEASGFVVLDVKQL